MLCQGHGDQCGGEEGLLDIGVGQVEVVEEIAGFLGVGSELVVVEDDFWPFGDGAHYESGNDLVAQIQMVSCRGRWWLSRSDHPTASVWL